MDHFSGSWVKTHIKYKNLQAEIWHLNTQKYKKLFSLAKENRLFYKKSLQFWLSIKLVVWENSDKKLVYTFSLIYICLDFH